MKKTRFTQGSDEFDKSHFLIKDDSDVPSGTHRHYSSSGYVDGLNRRAWAMAGIQNNSLVFLLFSFSLFRTNQEST